MKWNARPLAGFGLILTLAAGAADAQSVGAQGWSDPYGAQYSAPQPQSQAQQPQRRSAPIAPPQDQASETWRAADGSIRTRQRPQPAQPQYTPPAQQPVYQAQPQPQSTGPGAGYAIPGSGYPAPSYAPAQPQRDVAPQQQPVYAASDAADPTSGMSGPRGSSQPGAGEQRYDEVGYAGVRSVAGGGAANGAVVGVHRSVPANTVLEVTSLDTGRTALVLITGTMGPGADHPLDLSEGAAQQLGLAPGSGAPVRVRSVIATPQDMLALRAGRPAASRPDAPQVLLTALRKRLSAAPVAAAPSPAYQPARGAPQPARSAYAAPQQVRPAASGRYLVQVAALSSSANAQSLARSLGGSVKAGGGLYRVQLGPFATTAEAERARAGAARAGYGDARVLTN